MFLFSFYLKERVKQRNLPSVDSLTRWAQQLGLDQAEVRDLELNPGFLHGQQSPNSLSRHLLLPVVSINGKLDLETELGLEPMHGNMGCRHSIQCFNHYTKSLP